MVLGRGATTTCMATWAGGAMAGCAGWRGRGAVEAYGHMGRRPRWSRRCWRLQQCTALVEASADDCSGGLRRSC
eukprot:13735155-Heterocapsa_arctica.AAC.1